MVGSSDDEPFFMKGLLMIGLRMGRITLLLEKHQPSVIMMMTTSYDDDGGDGDGDDPDDGDGDDDDGDDDDDDGDGDDDNDHGDGDGSNDEGNGGELVINKVLMTMAESSVVMMMMMERLYLNFFTMAPSNFLRVEIQSSQEVGATSIDA